jgi:hypothetical protein
MKKTLILAGLLVSYAASAQQAASCYRIDLAPSGKMLAKDRPVVKNGAYVFHSYPAGTLMSLRSSQVRGVTMISPEAAAASNPAESVVRIGNLAMQGGSTQAGPTNASAVRGKAAKGGPELGEGFYSNLKMGESLAPDAASMGDYQIGRTYAAPPATAVQSSPGSPPTMPGATSGANPPTMSSASDGTNPQ